MKGIVKDVVVLILSLALDYLITAGILAVIFWALAMVGLPIGAWSWGLSFIIWVIIKCIKMLLK